MKAATIILFCTSELFAATVEVSTANQLIAAHQLLTGEDVTIILTGEMTLDSGVPIVNGQSHDLTVIGRLGAALRFTGCKPDGWPVRCRNFTMVGVEVSDYEGVSQAIDLQAIQRAVITDCTFRRIGRMVWPALKTPTTQAHDTVYVQAVGGWGADADVAVIGCTFVDVAGGQVRWSHPLYLLERSILVSDCLFERCGGGVALQTTSGSPVFVRNVWRDSTRGNESYLSWQYPDFWYGGRLSAVVVGNTISGPVRWVWGGYCEGVVQLDNDWSQAEPTAGVWWPTSQPAK